jgi:DNA-directed RNA polymerase specialized sigma24 family protein
MGTRASSGHTTHRSVISGIKRTASSPKWADFWEQYAPYIRRICRSKLRGEADIDEAVSKTMVCIYQQIRNYDPRLGTFRAWMKTIANRRAIEEFRGGHPAGEEEYPTQVRNRPAPAH